MKNLNDVEHLIDTKNLDNYLNNVEHKYAEEHPNGVEYLKDIESLKKTRTSH